MKDIVLMSHCSRANNAFFSFVPFVNPLVVSNKVIITGTYKSEYFPKRLRSINRTSPNGERIEKKP